MASNRLEILVAGDAREFANTLDQVNKATNDMVGNLVAQSQKAALALGGMSAAGGALIATFVSKAGEMQGFEATLSAITGSVEGAKEKLREFSDFAATTPFELPGVVQAGVTITGLKLATDEWLPRAGNLAAVMRRDIPEAALILGKAAKGSRDGLQSLYDSGVTTEEELVKLGAAFDKSTKSIDVSKTEQLQAALAKLVDGRFGDIMEKQSQTLNGALSNLSDSIGQVQASLGQQLAPTIEGAARSMTALLDGVKNMDPGVKSLAATGLLVGTVFTGIAAAIVTFQLAIVPATAFVANYIATTQASVAANAEAAIAAHAHSVSLVEQTAAEVTAAEALLFEAQMAAANATTKAESIVAAEGLAIAETELAAATEAAAAANVTYTGTANAALAATGRNAAAATGLTGRMVTLATTGIGPLVIAAGLVGGALMVMTAAMESTTAAQEKQIASSKVQLKAMHEQADAAVAASEAIKKYGNATDEAVDQVRAALKRLGKDDLDVTRAMAGNGEILRNLREQQRKLNMTSGNEEQKKIVADQIADYEKRNDVLRKARTDMRGMHDAEVAEANKKQEALKKEQEAAEKLLETYKKKSSHGVFANDKEQLAALDQVLGAIGKQHKEYEDLSLDRVKLERKAGEETRKAAEDAAKEKEKLRKDELEGEKHKLELIVGNDESHIAQRIALLQQLLAGSLANKEERRRLEVDLAREVESLEKAKAAAAKKASEDKKKADEEASKVRGKLLEAERKSADAELAVLQEQFRQGENVLPQLEAQIKKRQELAGAIEMEKAAHEGIGKSAGAQHNLRKAAEAEVGAEAKKTQLEIQKLRETQAKRDADNSAAAKKDAAEKAKLDEQDAKAKFDVDAKFADEYKRKMDERHRAEKDAAIEAARKDSIGASAEEKTRIRRDLELELRKLAQDQVKEARDLTAEIEKQKALKDGDKKDSGFTLGGVTGVEGMNDFSAFDLTSKKKKDAQKKLKELEADQAKAKREADDESKKLEQNLGGDETAGYPGLESEKKPKPSPTKDPKKGQGAGEQGQAGEGAAGLQAVVEGLAQVASILKEIKAQKVEVDIKGGAAGAAKAAADDWRTSTNKTGE